MVQYLIATSLLFAGLMSFSPKSQCSGAPLIELYDWANYDNRYGPQDEYVQLIKQFTISMLTQANFTSDDVLTSKCHTFSHRHNNNTDQSRNNNPLITNEDITVDFIEQKLTENNYEHWCFYYNNLTDMELQRFSNISLSNYTPEFGLFESLEQGAFDGFVAGIGNAGLSLSPTESGFIFFRDISYSEQLKNDQDTENDHAKHHREATSLIVEFWEKCLGRNSYDNENSTIKISFNNPLCEDNAFWNGAAIQYCVSSAGANQILGLEFFDIENIDRSILGHELYHGIESSVDGGLIYEANWTKASGALSEASADIFGMMSAAYISYRIRNKNSDADTLCNWDGITQYLNQTDWVVGEIFKPDLNEKRNTTHQIANMFHGVLNGTYDNLEDGLMEQPEGSIIVIANDNDIDNKTATQTGQDSKSQSRKRFVESVNVDNATELLQIYYSYMSFAGGSPDKEGLRFLNDPSEDRMSPNCHQAAFINSTVDHGGVHINSGILNTLFYLLTAGGENADGNCELLCEPEIMEQLDAVETNSEPWLKILNENYFRKYLPGWNDEFAQTLNVTSLELLQLSLMDAASSDNNCYIISWAKSFITFFNKDEAIQKKLYNSKNIQKVTPIGAKHVALLLNNAVNEGTALSFARDVTYTEICDVMINRINNQQGVSGQDTASLEKSVTEASIAVGIYSS
eukprot:Awhi_evm1s10865